MINRWKLIIELISNLKSSYSAFVVQPMLLDYRSDQLVIMSTSLIEPR